MHTPLPLSARMAEIQPFHVMALLARARDLERKGRHIIHMEIGEPDFPTPEPIIQAGHEALSAGHTHYTPATGLPALREAIAGFYRQRYGVEVAPERIVVTPGASGALLLVLAALVDPGNQVLMSDPGYPCNRHFVRLFEGRAKSIPVTAETDYQVTPDLLRAHWSGRAVAALVASPSNPTGTVIYQPQMAAMADFVESKGGRLIVDEIYHGLVYEEGNAVTTALSISDQLFVINSFSKYFGMTGWRLGWTVAPEAYVPELDKLAQNLFLAPSTPAQYAALAAFDDATLTIVEERRREFQARRDYLVPALLELGFEVPAMPQGAFYVYARSRKLAQDSFVFAQRLLEEASVAVTPGIDFGAHGARDHLRFAYTTDLDSLREGVSRLRAFLS
ncbi:MAG: pyridoxal phosphate-dependent aminotransferase [Gammaproteobacteria bacterium]|jgi:aspartate/methionine/tyrosine aminotransferase